MSPAWLAGLINHALAAMGGRQQQLMLIEKTDKIFDLLGIDHQRCICLDVGGNFLRITWPAQQTFVLEPANAIKAVADRILNRP